MNSYYLVQNSKSCLSIPVQFQLETTIGKRWRRDVHFNSPLKDGKRIEPEWMIGEYYELPESEKYDRFGKELTGIRWYWALDEDRNVHRGKL